MNKAELMARDAKRIEAVHTMCIHMNTQYPKIQSELFFMGDIGYARVFWNGKQWMTEWFDNAIRFENQNIST